MRSDIIQTARKDTKIILLSTLDSSGSPLYSFQEFFCTFIYSKGVSEADGMPYESRSSPKQFPSSPPKGKQREPRKGPETGITGEIPDGMPSRPQSSTPHSDPGKPGTRGEMTAGTQKVTT